MGKPSIADVLALDFSERMELAQALWDSLRESPDKIPLTDAEREELDRRLRTYYKDPDAGSPWPEVRKRITGSE